MEPGLLELVRHKLIEDGKYLFTIGVNPLEIVLEIRLEAGSVQPFLERSPRNIDVLAKGIDGMPSQEQPIKHCRFFLRRQRVEIVPSNHLDYSLSKITGQKRPV